jgi:hypothetical protein
VLLTWSNPVPTKGYQDTTVPAYLSMYTGGGPVGFRYDTPLDLADLMRELAGSDVPIVFLPKILRDSTGGHEQRALGAFLGRITSASIDLDSVLGDELVDETLRVQEVEIEEET